MADNVPKLVTCDAQRLQQVLLNVLNNAVKFTEKGEVLLEVWCDNPTSDAPAKHAQQATDDSQDSLIAMSANHGDAGEVCHQQQQQQGPLFGKLSQESSQLVENKMARLEPFRPLTPDNLSQHTELAEMRQQLEGPEPKSQEDLSDNVDVLAASFDSACSNQQCPATSAQQAEQAVSCSAGSELLAKQHQLPATPRYQAQGPESSPLAAASQQKRRLCSAPNSSSQEDGCSRASSNSFANAAPATTKTGQQYILDTSTASAAPRAAVRGSSEASAEVESAATPEAAPQAEACIGTEQATSDPGLEATTEAGPAPHSEAQRRAGLSAGFDNVTAEEAAEEAASSVCHHGQKVDGNADDNCIRRDTSTSSASGHSPDEPADDSCIGRDVNTVSTSGQSADEPAYYTLNFSVRDSGIGISNESMNSLFQCFAQVLAFLQLAAWSLAA